jgi:hypothetical protein
MKLWAMLDEMVDGTGKGKGRGEESGSGIRDTNSHKKHGAKSSPISSTGSMSSDSLFMSRLRDLLKRDEDLYGKGYGDYLRSHIKGIQEEMKDGKRETAQLSDAVTFDVLVKILGVWEKDEKARKMNAFEVSPPRRAGTQFFSDSDATPKSEIPTAALTLEFQGYSQYVEICAMTSPTDVVNQFISHCPAELASTKAAKKIIKQNLEYQMLDLKIGLLRAEIDRLAEKVQERADKHVMVDEVYRYYRETIEEGGEGEGKEEGEEFR